MEVKDVILQDPQIALLQHLAGGKTLDAFLTEYPSVSRRQAVAATEDEAEPEYTVADIKEKHGRWSTRILLP